MRAFTLVEVVTVLAVVAILGLMVLPALGRFISANAVTAGATELQTALNYARGMALSRRSRVVLCRSGNVGVDDATCDQGPGSGSHDGYEDGWLIFVDPDHDGQPGSAQDILRRTVPAGHDRITIRGNHNAVNRIYFSPGGTTTAIATFVVCGTRGWSEGGRSARLVTVSFGGRVRSEPGDRQTGTTISSCQP
jgi:type IV fimbrial biogenesis protein FimT